MQFIPSNIISEAADLFATVENGIQKGKRFVSSMKEALNDSGYPLAGNRSQKSETFKSAMADALDAVRDGVNHSVSAALNESSPRLVESPYVKHTTDGITYTLSEVCFTKNELLELRQQLIKEGVSEVSLKQFDILANQPDGATLAQLMAALIPNKAEINISEADEQTLTALLGQIDPTGQLSSDAISFMRSGNGSAALELIEGALDKMDLTDGIDVDMDSMLALGRGLGLTEDSLRGILGNFGDKDNLLLNNSQFDALLKPAKNQFMEAAAAQQKMDTALDKTLKPIISRARDRMEKEKAAASLQDRRVEQSRVLIDKTVQENSRQMLDDTATGQTSLNSAQNSKTDTSKVDTVSGKVKAEFQELQPQKDAKDLRTDKEILSSHDTGQTLTSETAKSAAFQKDGSFDNSDSSRQDAKDVWQNLLNRVEARVTQPMPQAASFVYNMGEMEAAQPAMPNLPNLSAHVASQVQQGMLTAFRDGSTRLELQLHPAELGAISITLVARNGELTAQIRSEKGETADMVSRQLDAIRINLEQQGVKIDKIEVQLQNSQDQRNDAFMDLGQHNARQEENARRQELTRMRNLASLRNITANNSESALARDMHIREQQARYAGNALSVIA